MISAEESNRVAYLVQALQSDIQIIASHVHWLQLNAYPGTDYKPEEQPVMCDFEIVRHENPSRLYVSLLVEVENSKKTSPRENIFFSLSIVSEFEFRRDGVSIALPEDEAKRWQIYASAVAMAYSVARGYMVNYLAPTHYRNYLLPSIDPVALVNRKYQRPQLPVVPTTRPSEKPKKVKGKGTNDETTKPDSDLK